MSKPIDQERELFEAAITKDGWPHADRVDRLPSGDYSLPRVQNKWLGWQMARASVQPAGVAVPDGWMLVPVELTEEMRAAFNQVDQSRYVLNNRQLFKGRHAWSRMLAAAPHPVSGEQPVCKTCNDSACDPRFEQLIPCPDCAAKPADTGDSEFYIDHAVLRAALGNCGIAAPESDSELGDRMASYAKQVVRSVSKQPAAQDVSGLVQALEKIVRWDGFPATGKTWPESGEPMSYSACHGSNGERDYMRRVAREAIATHRAQAQGGSK